MGDYRLPTANYLAVKGSDHWPGTFPEALRRTWIQPCLNAMATFVLVGIAPGMITGPTKQHGAHLDGVTVGLQLH